MQLYEEESGSMLQVQGFYLTETSCSAMEEYLIYFIHHPLLLSPVTNKKIVTRWFSLFVPHEGTAQDGKVDEWYGESGRGSENKSQRYNVQEVLNSKVGIAITAFITKQQLQAKALARMVENGSSDKGK